MATKHVDVVDLTGDTDTEDEILQGGKAPEVANHTPHNIKQSPSSREAYGRPEEGQSKPALSQAPALAKISRLNNAELAQLQSRLSDSPVDRASSNTIRQESQASQQLNIANSGRKITNSDQISKHDTERNHQIGSHTRNHGSVSFGKSAVIRSATPTNASITSTQIASTQLKAAKSQHGLPMPSKVRTDRKPRKRQRERSQIITQSGSTVQDSSRMTTTNRGSDSLTSIPNKKRKHSVYSEEARTKVVDFAQYVPREAQVSSGGIDHGIKPGYAVLNPKGQPLSASRPDSIKTEAVKSLGRPDIPQYDPFRWRDESESEPTSRGGSQSSQNSPLADSKHIQRLERLWRNSGNGTDSSSESSMGIYSTRRQNRRRDLRQPAVAERIHEIEAVGTDKVSAVLYPSQTRGSLLRQRDMSTIGGLANLDPGQFLARHQNSYLDTMLRPWRSWTGAAKDVIRTAWAPNGLSFVVGSTTDMDALNLQYNRGNNLLWTDLRNNTITELDEHKVARPPAAPGSSQDNAALREALDPYVFTTISDICYDNSGTRFLTAGYDRTVKTWNVTEDGPVLKSNTQFDNKIDIIDRSSHTQSDVLACAFASTHDEVIVFKWPEADDLVQTDAVLRNERSSKRSLSPSCMTWGTMATNSADLLAVGYGDDQVVTKKSRGDIVLWDVNKESTTIDLSSSTSCVHDLAWHSREPWLFAATNVAPKKQARGVQSHIKLWKPCISGQCNMEIDCPALDVNRVLPDPSGWYVSVACTDGAIYHYDIRRPSNILAKFQHGPPIATMGEELSREQQDFGCQFLSWNAAGTLLYSGSSDGVIKQWNPLLNEADAFIEDIASFDAGVSSGRFSPDHTNLLIGTMKGSVHVLSSAPVTPWVDVDAEDEDLISVGVCQEGTFTFRPAKH